MPKVSVIIPTYNRPSRLKRAVQSVLSQTFGDYEILVVDDGLKVRADNIVKEFDNIKIKYIQHSKNQGAPAARNTGMKASQGVYVAFLDDDDEWDPDKLAKQVDAMDKYQEDVRVVFCGVEMFDKEGKYLFKKLPGESGIVKPFERLLHKAYIWTSSILMSRKCIDEGFYFDETLPKNQEWDLTLRLAKKHSFYAIDEPLVRLNILGDDEHLGGLKNLSKIIQGDEMLLQKHRDDYRGYPKALAMRYFRLARFHVQNNEISKARSSFLKAFVSFPRLMYLKHYIMSFCGLQIYNSFDHDRK